MWDKITEYHRYFKMKFPRSFLRSCFGFISASSKEIQNSF